MMATGASRTTPSKALFSLLNISQLQTKIEMTALAGCRRLRRANSWRKDCGIETPHRKIESKLLKVDKETLYDRRETFWNFNRGYITIVRERTVLVHERISKGGKGSLRLLQQQRR